MPKIANLFLTGMMGSGKSSVGKLVAESLGYSFVDTDALIESRAGMTITEIFAGPGEAHFRQLEKELLVELVQSERQIVATGGGMLANDTNMGLASQHGMVIYLEAPPGVLLSRISGERNRPLLDESDELGALEKILAARREAYEKADLTMNVADVTKEQIAQTVTGEFKKWLAS